MCSLTTFTSCETFDDILEEVISDFAVGKTWNNGGYSITKISWDMYWVEDNNTGYGEEYYLMPFTEALRYKPYNLRVLDHYPIIRSEGLRWYVKTSRGDYHVFSGGGWSKI